jgi:hypothetical protein
MTTWTTEDREYAKLHTQPTVIVDCGASYEPVPFVGWVDVDKEDTEVMLRKQLHIVNDEVKRLKEAYGRMFDAYQNLYEEWIMLKEKYENNNN